MKLHIDDIDDLVSLLKSQSGGVQLWAGEARAENGAEDLLSARNEEIENVRIVSSKPQIEIILRYHEAKAGTNDRGQRAQRTVDQVAQLLAPRKRHFVTNRTGLLNTSFLGITAIANAAYTAYQISRYGYYPGSVYALAFPIILSAGMIARLRRSRRHGRALIFRRTLRERFLFQSTSRREVSIGLIMAGIGAALSAIAPLIAAALRLLGDGK